MTRAPIFALVLATPLLASVAAAQDATVPGEVNTPHPTLEHISIDWAITGDDDLDGRVTVRFREQGVSAWREGHPLMRVPGETHEGHTWANRHSGSLFGLRPDTTYEIELTLTDPDGGSATRSVTARTRPVPRVPDSARDVEATPATVGRVLAEAMPGDRIVLAPGTYGTLRVPNDGTADRPIVLVGSDRERVIVEGEVRMDGRSHVWVEDLWVRGQIKFNGATGIVVRRCRVEASTSTGDGIVALTPCTDCYVADNHVTGRTTWNEAALGVSGDNLGEGIALTGPGNVIAYNYVSGFRDCISLLEGSPAVDQVSIDILGNDVSSCPDDGIEADFAMGNVRVLRNRINNSFIALSSQPGLGGPTYFIRNVVYNCVFQAFKPHRSSRGDIWYHNTVVKPGDAMGVYAGRPWYRATFRNNIFIGGADGGDYGGYSNGEGAVLWVPDADVASSDFDYDAFGSIGTGIFRGTFGATRFASLAELRERTTERHAIEVDLSVFEAAVAFPRDPFPEREAPSLLLAPGSAAVDHGERIPTINDAFAGAAPDLGAYELGSLPPRYGPRDGAPVCGDGVVEPPEECDDGNRAAGDGCSPTCTVEPGGPLPDGGGLAPDGGTRDASLPDGGSMARPDAGVGEGAAAGCGCVVGARSPRGGAVALVLLALVARLARRRAAHRTSRLP